MADIAITGGGVAGLAAAMLLAGDGHDVTLFERDDAEPPAPSEAWEKLGASLRKTWLRLRKTAEEAPAPAAAERFKFLLPVLGGDGQSGAAEFAAAKKAQSYFTVWLRERAQGQPAQQAWPRHLPSNLLQCSGRFARPGEG